MINKVLPKFLITYIKPTGYVEAKIMIRATILAKKRKLKYSFIIEGFTLE